MLQSSSRQPRGRLALVSLFAALTAAGAFIKIPLPYVPFTLQTLFVCMAGVVLGPRFGALSQVVYLAVGLIGVPVFANGGGPGYVLQPSFGYLLAYPFAAMLVGELSWGRRGPGFSSLPKPTRIAAASVAGMAVVYLLGVSVLYWNLNNVVGKPTTFERAFQIGFLVFLPGTILKIVLCSYLGARINTALTAANQEQG